MSSLHTDHLAMSDLLAMSTGNTFLISPQFSFIATLHALREKGRAFRNNKQPLNHLRGGNSHLTNRMGLFTQAALLGSVTRFETQTGNLLPRNVSKKAFIQRKGTFI